MSHYEKYRRQTVRLKGYDYGSDGAYFITICSYNRRCIFGTIKNEIMYLSELGKSMEAEWLKTATIREYITLGKFTVMPNHIHGIIFIHKHSKEPLQLASEVIFSKIQLTGFKNSFGPQKENLGSVIRGFKSAVTTRERKRGNTAKIWQPKFHEHIIRNQEELLRIENYISMNVKKWNEDKFSQ